MYPTFEEILAEPTPKYRPEVLAFVRAWRQEWQGQRRSEDALRALVTGLADVYGRPVSSVEFMEVGAHYEPMSGRVVLVKGKGSVVTALHELAHHLFGVSELKACRWSVHLFRRAFPRAYANTHFEGHLLVKGAGPNVAASALADPFAALLAFLGTPRGAAADADDE
jgi:hypothetical protein